MLNNTLNTNEIKNAAGTAVGFTRVSTGTRNTEFASLTESPARPDRLKISHLETGSGFTRRRRSVVRFDYNHVSDVDSTKTVTTSAYMVLDAPVGAVVSTTPLKDTLARLISFCASLGANTTILYDCTGNGAVVLTRGDL